MCAQLVALRSERTPYARRDALTSPGRHSGMCLLGYSRHAHAPHCSLAAGGRTDRMGTAAARMTSHTPSAPHGSTHSQRSSKTIGDDADAKWAFIAILAFRGTAASLEPHAAL